VQRLAAFARAASLPLQTAAARIAETDELPAAARSSLARLAQALRRWREAAESLAPAALLELVMDESGYRRMLETDRSPEAETRLDNLKELARAIEDYADVSAFLEHVALVMDNDRNEGAEQATIMTLHAAKGLEFDHVFLAGWEEGLFPSQRALDEGGEASLEEERRLAYVGITRARRRATILTAANRRIYGQWTSALPSRFLAELPDAHVTRETTLSGGASLWRAAVHSGEDPFAHLARGTGRGPGWARAGTRPSAPPVIEGRVLKSMVGGEGRSDIQIGARVFHQKFGAGTVKARDAAKLEVDFDHAGTKMVLDSFVEPVS
jgi:DNA helicase-2/ATP-dependent DNA helicase PcrA